MDNDDSDTTSNDNDDNYDDFPLIYIAIIKTCITQAPALK